MRGLPAAIAAAIDSGAAHLCAAFILTRTDGARLGFTNHDCDLTVAGVACAAATGWMLGAADSDLSASPGTASATAALDSAAITEADIAAGRYDGARVAAYRLDWTAPDQPLLLWRATISRLVRNGPNPGGGFSAEMEGPLALLQRVAGRTYAKLCDAVLGDGRCGADVSGPSFNGGGAILGSADGRRLAVSGIAAFAAGWFAGGRLVWTGGANAGRLQTVAAHLIGENGVTLVLEETALGPVAAGDGFTVRAGCDKGFATCAAKFVNTANHQGFPDIPGDDYLTVNAATAPVTDGSSRRAS